MAQHQSFEAFHTLKDWIVGYQTASQRVHGGCGL
jgi:hypothetical protein